LTNEATEANMEGGVTCPYHGGSGTDRYFRLEPGEHINRIVGRYGSDHIENLVFHTTRGRASEAFGSNTGTDFNAVAPTGMVLRHISGRSDGYLNAIRCFWGEPVAPREPVPGTVSQLYGHAREGVFNDSKEATGRVLRTVHLRAAAAVDGIQLLYGMTTLNR
jgi:hypothetical protein